MGRRNREADCRMAFSQGWSAIAVHPFFDVSSDSWLSPAVVHLPDQPFWFEIDEDFKPRAGHGIAHKAHPPRLRFNAARSTDAGEWAHVAALALLAYMTCTVLETDEDPRMRAARWADIDRLAGEFGVGTRPADFDAFAPPLGNTPARILENSGPEILHWDYVSRDLVRTTAEGRRKLFPEVRKVRAELMAKGYRRLLRSAMKATIAEADENADKPGRRAMVWFMGNYPLLGALAAGFSVVENETTCRNMRIDIAAVSAFPREIYLNPKAGLDEMETRFVVAHEILHVALRHFLRRNGRDPFLWNVAADFVINRWLVEMGIGRMPQRGLLLDMDLGNGSVEEIYDRIVRDVRLRRRLARTETNAGIGRGDMLDDKPAEWWRSAEAVTLDEFVRRSLANGLDLHYARGRGTLPADLVEEIRSILQDAVPWDVELAQWFDERFKPLESRRTYARPSRRQSAVPDIPLPGRMMPEEYKEGRTFAVLLDSSGSMDRNVLAKGLGTVVAYARERDVERIRLVQCDAAAHDEGYVAVEDLLGAVRIVGRGGTVLEPGLRLIQDAKEFPPNGPILIVTDGYIDDLHPTRDHAYLMPAGSRLPYRPRGPVFFME